MSGLMMWPLKLFKSELLMIVILAYVSYYVTFPSVSGDMGIKWREIIKEDRCRSTFIFDHQILVTQQLLYKAAWALIDHYRIIRRVMDLEWNLFNSRFTIQQPYDPDVTGLIEMLTEILVFRTHRWTPLSI